MTDREKVVKGLHQHCECSLFDRCGECPYYETDYNSWEESKFTCRDELLTDALALLKEQEAVKPKSKVRHGANAQIQHFCGNCNTMLHGKPKFCSECGKGVLW